jgi:hypothetical protein
VSLPPEIPQAPNRLNAQQEAANQLEEVQREMTGFERATLRWAKVAVAMSAVAAFFVCLQWWEMHQGGIDTHALAVAADTQAKKMTDMSTAADKIRQAAEDVVAQEGRIADNSQKAIEASNRQNKAALDATISQNRLDQRAWVGQIDATVSEVTEGRTATFTITLNNSGKTPALRMAPKFRSFVGTPATQNIIPSYGPTTGNNVRGGRGVLQPNGRGLLVQASDHQLTHVDIERLKAGEMVYWIFGRIDYEDIFKRAHTTTFCDFVETNLTSLAPCPTYNDAD